MKCRSMEKCIPFLVASLEEGPTASQRKRYARSVNSVTEGGSDDQWESDLVFTRADLRDVVPHDNDPVVISIVTAGRKVHRVLVDHGSSADVMFWSMFNKLQLSPDLLRPYTRCLYGFTGDRVEVRGYLELRMTFTDGTMLLTESIRYLVVNADSPYNILLGRPALNRLRAVASTHHMKMKLPDLSDKVIVIKSDQEEARKCYENSLKTKRGLCFFHSSCLLIFLCFDCLDNQPLYDLVYHIQNKCNLKNLNNLNNWI